MGRDGRRARGLRRRRDRIARNTALVLALAIPVRAHAGFDERAIWPSGTVRGCVQSRDDHKVWTCLENAMVRGGASSSAVAFAKQLAGVGQWGWMSGYRPYGSIGVATVTHPFRANTNQVTVLTAERPTIVDVDAYVLSDDDRERNDFQALHGQHPRANVWPNAILERHDILGNGGQRFIFKADFRDCGACATYGAARISYKFTPDGALEWSGLVSVTAD